MEKKKKKKNNIKNRWTHELFSVAVNVVISTLLVLQTITIGLKTTLIYTTIHGFVYGR